MNSKISVKQPSSEGRQAAKLQYDDIFLGVDLHKASITVTRIIDNCSPQPAQRFGLEPFFSFVEKQTTLAQNVYLAYEAGAFGFWPHSA